MSSPAPVVLCALALLGRSVASMPPIEMLEQAPPDASSYAVAFVRNNPDTIYLIGSSPVIREMRESRDRCENVTAVKKLASILVHEEWHILHGADERGAYYAQLTTLASLGLGAGTAEYNGVMRSMQAVVRAHERAARAEMLVAARR